jgi:UDP-glucose 4-epimerase
MNIAITGIGGYFGQKILVELSKENIAEKIIGVDIREPQLKMKNFTFYKCDIKNPELSKYFEQNQIDTVLHLAFIVKPIHDQNRAYDINVNGTKNVLQACKKASVKKVIVASSGAVYGAHSDNPKFLTEDVAVRPNHDYYYCLHKYELERLCHLHKKENPQTIVTIFRPCNLYGKQVDDLLSQSYEGKKIYLFRGFDPERQLIHEEDAVNGFLLAIKKDGDGTFNLASDGPFITTKRLASLVNKDVFWLPSSKFMYYILRLMWKTHLAKSPAGFMHFRKYRWVLSNEKIKKDLGFRPRYSTEEAFLSKYIR